MREILDEYGEAILGVIAAMIIIGEGYVLFAEGGALYQFFSNIANSSI